MDGIRIRNLRCLEDTGMVDLKPITLLLGANSSGKSTFLRTIPLFKQSINAKTIGPLLWYGNEVDFGAYDTALRMGESQMEFSFFWKELTAIPYTSYAYKGTMRDISVSLTLEKKDDDTAIKNYIVHIGDNTISVGSRNYTEWFDATVNGKPYSQYGIKNIINLPYDKKFIPEIMVSGKEWGTYMDVDKNVITVLQAYLRETSLREHADKFDISTYVTFNLASRKEMVMQLVQKLNVEDANPEQLCKEPAMENFLNLYIFTCLRYILCYLNTMLVNEFSKSYYIKPFRASAERYYRWQNLAINTLDSDGNNMAMFVENMYKQKKEKQRFMAWTRDLFGFELNVHNPEGHSSLLIQETDGNAYNIADKGFGYSQILPVILTLWQIFSKAEEKGRGESGSILVAIEQPELHLHPKLQAKLMDAFVAVINAARAIGLDIKLMIETHSPTLINRLGIKIARRQYSHEDATILLFHAQNEGKQSPQIAAYDNEGILSNWPAGFFETE